METKEQLIDELLHDRSELEMVSTAIQLMEPVIRNLQGMDDCSNKTWLVQQAQELVYELKDTQRHIILHGD